MVYSFQRSRLLWLLCVKQTLGGKNESREKGRGSHDVAGVRDGGGEGEDTKSPVDLGYSVKAGKTQSKGPGASGFLGRWIPGTTVEVTGKRRKSTRGVLTAVGPGAQSSWGP